MNRTKKLTKYQNDPIFFRVAELHSLIKLADSYLFAHNILFNCMSDYLSCLDSPLPNTLSLTPSQNIRIKTKTEVIDCLAKSVLYMYRDPTKFRTGLQTYSSGFHLCLKIKIMNFV